MLRHFWTAGLASLLLAAPATAQVINAQPTNGWIGGSSASASSAPTIILSGATTTPTSSELPALATERSELFGRDTQADQLAVAQLEQDEPEIELAGAPGDRGSIGVNRGVLATVVESATVAELDPKPADPWAKPSASLADKPVSSN